MNRSFPMNGGKRVGVFQSLDWANIGQAALWVLLRGAFFVVVVVVGCLIGRAF